MSKRHGIREQKRLAKKNAKRDAQRRQLARRDSPDPTVRLKAADRWPVVKALVPENLWSLGIGQLVIARRTPDGRLACAMFLLDVFCLGVKDAFWRILSDREFDEIRTRVAQEDPLKQVTPEHFAKLVYRAADYGQSLGFPPHRDFRHAQRLLAGIDPSQCPDEFEFGHEGRPLYIRGPYESLDRAHAIAAQVEAAGGHCTIPLDAADIPPELLDFDIDDESDDELDADELGDVEWESEDDEPDPPDTPRRWSWLPWR